MSEEKLNKTWIKWRGNVSQWRWYACENNGWKKRWRASWSSIRASAESSLSWALSAVLDEMEETEAGIATAETVWFSTLSHTNLRSYTNKEICFSWSLYWVCVFGSNLHRAWVALPSLVDFTQRPLISIKRMSLQKSWDCRGNSSRTILVSYCLDDCNCSCARIL